MSKFTLKGNTSGKYFVAGAGFSATSANAASKLSADEVEGVQQCARNFGAETSTKEAASEVSFGVVYIRKGDKVSVTGVTKVKGDLGQNQLDPSKRRFATFKEAATHAGRFQFRRASRNDAVDSGTAGHVGAFVIQTNDPVNSGVNPATGKTNSL